VYHLANSITLLTVSSDKHAEEQATAESGHKTIFTRTLEKQLV
jgi:hypothetical protein